MQKSILTYSLFWLFLGLWMNLQAQFQFGQSGTSQFLYDVWFHNTDEGLAIGDTGTILTSGDGGLTWATIPSPVQDNFRVIAFFDAQVGLIAGNHLLRTIDGGLTWDILAQTQNRYFDIEIVDSQTAYLSHPFEGLLKTTNQGLTWDTLVQENQEGSLGLLSYVHDSLMYASQHGQPPGGRIHRSTDGGINWQEITMQTGSENSVLEVFEFINPDTGFIGGWYNPYLAKTTDAGNNWTFTTNDDTQNGGQINDASFPSAKAYYACGWHNLIMRSTDKGLTWSMMDHGLPSNESFKGMFFLNDSTGWIVGTNGTVVILKDSAVSVSISRPHTPPSPYQAIYSPESREIVILGRNQRLLKTSIWQLDGQLLNTYEANSPIPSPGVGIFLVQFHTPQRVWTQKIRITSR